MKKALSMLVALAMVLTLVVAVAPVADAADNVVCQVTDVEVSVFEPYIWEWEATGNGIMSIEATPGYVQGSVNAAFKVNIYANEAEFLANETPSVLEGGSYQTPGGMWGAQTDYEVSTGNYVVVELVAQQTYSTTDGTVSMTVTFDQGGAVVKDESIIDWDTVLDIGQNDLTLNESAYNTLYVFAPDEIGVYTLSVNDGATIGYWGAGTFYYTNPNSTATSIEREIKQVGQEMLIGISSEDPNVVLTIEKSGESGGIVEVVYINWENTHTPTSSLAGAQGKTLTPVNINETHDAVLGEDGFYHLDSAAGPVLYVDMISEGFNLLLCYGLGGDGGEVATRLRGDYNGEHYEFLGSMQEYANVLNGTDGTYPLTEDLYVFLNSFGKDQGWYKSNLSSFPEIMDGEFNEDTAWMVSLSYVDGEVAPHECVKSEDYLPEYADDWSYWDEIYSCELCGKPMETVRWYVIYDMDDTTVDYDYVTEVVGAGETNNYIISSAGTVLVMEEGDFTLTIDGVVQTPVDGFYYFELTSNFGTEINITNTGNADAEYEMIFAYPFGSYEKPDELIPGTTDVLEFVANNNGYYYNFVASCDGVLSATVTGDGWMFSFSNFGDPDNWADDQWGDTFYSDGDVNSESIVVKAGDVVEFYVSTYDPNAWELPAGTVTVEFGLKHSADGLIPGEPSAPGHATPGLGEHYTCPDCNGTFDAEGNAIDATIPATGHTTAVFVPEVPATEEADGMEEHWYCADCDAYFTDAECNDEVERDDLVITYIPETGDMNIAALAVALMAATAGAVIIGKKKEI